MKNAALAATICGSLLLALSLFAGSAISQTPQGAQDYKYTMCLINHGVRPPKITRDQVETCLEEAGVPNPGADAYQNARKKWQSCITSNVSQLDDGISPPNDIASIVAPMCISEWIELAEATWINPGARVKLVANSAAMNAVTPVVLMVRKLVRDSSVKK